MAETKGEAVGLSVVVPATNEARSLPQLYEELTAALSALNCPYELIFVDDGSTDETFAILEGLHRQDARVRVIQFRRNFGKAAALTAGFSQARGEIVITLDADLQDDPHEIPRFLEAIEKEGYDLVSGWKLHRHDPAGKVWPSRFFNSVVRAATGVQLHDFNCGFKAYRREVIDEIEISGELHRYIAVLAHRKGYRVGEIVVEHRQRQFGRSKYGLERFSRGFFDFLTVLFLTQYTFRPLHLFGWLGLACGGLGMVINLYMAALWFAGDRPIGNRPLLILGVLLVIVGVQFFSFGLLGDIISRAANPAQSQYSIKRTLGC